MPSIDWVDILEPARTDKKGIEDEACPELLLTEAVSKADNPNIMYHRLTPCTHDVFRDAEEEILPLMLSFFKIYD